MLFIPKVRLAWGVRRHSGPAIVRASPAWRSLDDPTRQPTLARSHAVRVSELKAFGFCPEAHRLDLEYALAKAATNVPSQPGVPFLGSGQPLDPEELHWDTPQARRGRVAHAREAQSAQRPSGAWGSRSALVFCLLAILASLILRLG